MNLPEITAEERQFLHYNPNTDDIVAWVQAYAERAIMQDGHRDLLSLWKSVCDRADLMIFDGHKSLYFKEALLIEFGGAVEQLQDNPWKDAVIEALVINWYIQPEHEQDPKKAVADLVHWENLRALDPLISTAAQALIDRGRAEAVQWIRDHYQDHPTVAGLCDALLAKD